MIGKVYTIPPQPPVEEHTRWLDAGPVRLGVEYRELDPASLVATYAGNAAHLAELEERSPAGGFTDEGVSIHVSSACTGREHLRFDVFDGEPHYHYIHYHADGTVSANNVIDFDVTAHGEMLPWVLDTLRGRMGVMLAQAGADIADASLGDPAVTAAIERVAALAASAQQAQRAARAR
jgi:hypothetical protein